LGEGSGVGVEPRQGMKGERKKDTKKRGESDGCH